MNTTTTRARIKEQMNNIHTMMKIILTNDKHTKENNKLTTYTDKGNTLMDNIHSSEPLANILGASSKKWMCPKEFSCQ